MRNDAWYKSTVESILNSAEKLVKNQKLSENEDALAQKAAKLCLFENVSFQIYFNSIYSFLGSQNFEQIYSKKQPDWAREAAELWIAQKEPYELQSIPKIIAAQCYFATNGDLLRFQLQVKSYIVQVQKNENYFPDLCLCLQLKRALGGLKKANYVSAVLKVKEGEAVTVKLRTSALIKMDSLCDDCSLIDMKDVSCPKDERETLLQKIKVQGLIKPTINKMDIQEISYRGRILYRKQ